jgi:multidrug efflux system membrane fusion protein
MRYLPLALVAIGLSAVAGIAAYGRLEPEPAAVAKAAGAPAEKPKIAVVAAVAQRQDVPVTRSSVGWVEPLATVTVRARVEGEVLEQHVTDGQLVHKGDLLFQIDDREIRAGIAKDEAMLARGRATLARAQADLRRARDLLQKRVTAQQQVDQTEADAKIAAANVQADQAALDNDLIRLGFSTVRAPIDGRVGVVRVTPGNIVRASDGGDGLVTITQMKPLRVSFTLPERDLTAVRAADAQGDVAVRVFVHGAAQPLASGSLNFIDSSVDTASGTITAKATVPNDDGALWPGQYVDIELVLGKIPDAVTIPTVAVQPGQEGPFVYVVGADSKVAVRKVVTGEAIAEDVVVAEGLVAGDQVVVEGQLRLRNGSRVTATVRPEPHSVAQALPGAGS